MKNGLIMKAVALSLCIALLAVSAAGCGGSKVLAKVDGHKIYEQESLDFAKTWELLNENIEWSSFEKEQQDELVRGTYLSVLIDDYLVHEYFKDNGVTEKDVLTTEVKEQIKSVINDNIKGDAEMGALIKSGGITDAMLEEYCRYYFYTQAFMAKANEKIPVSDEEIQAYYDKNKDTFVSPASITASHILILDADHTPEKKAEMESILKKAKAGDDFAELAKQYSEDEGSKETGGDLGEITTETNFVPEFLDAAFKLQKAGDISEIVESEYGYHIIKATSDQTPDKLQTLEEAREEVLAQIQNENIIALIEELNEKAKIVYVNGLDPAKEEKEKDGETEADGDDATADAATGDATAGDTSEEKTE